MNDRNAKNKEYIDFSTHAHIHVFILQYISQSRMFVHFKINFNF